MAPNVVWLQIWRPTFAEQQVKTIFWRPHQKTVGKICTTTFWASLSKNPLHPQKFACSYTYVWYSLNSHFSKLAFCQHPFLCISNAYFWHRDDGPDIQRMLYHGAVLVRVAESEDFGWGRIPNTGSRIFCPTPDVQLDHFFTSHSQIRNSCWNGAISFETFVET